MIGRVLANRYELVERVGLGGMAYVYRAKDTVLKRDVAVKILKEQFQDDDEFVRKFEMEAQSAARLTHMNIVNVYDVGQSEVDGKLMNYIIMEFIEGTTLKEVIQKKGRLSNDEIINYGVQLANAIAAAHASGIIHRDIKPQNIMITKDGLVKVTDFGIARFSTNATITYTSTILGTVHYISPEQAKGKAIDQKSDIYSMGVVLYEMATGELPFDAENAVGIAVKHIQEDPVPPKVLNPNLSDTLNAVILKCMAKDPVDRVASSAYLAECLTSNGTPWDDHETELYNQTTAAFDGADLAAEAERARPKRKVVYKSPVQDEPVAPPPVKKKKSEIILPLVLGLLTVMVLFVGSKFFRGQKVDLVSVPKVEGLSEAAAVQILESEGFVVDIAGKVESTEVPEGSVVSQDPRPDAEAEVGSEVKLEISSGIAYVAVPDLLKQTESDAEAALATLNLKLGKIRQDFDDEIEEGLIISQNPEARESAAPGSEVEIVISRGPKVKNVNMPKLLGMSQVEAITALSKAGLGIGNVSQEFSDTYEEGKVCFQSRVEGAEVAEGTQVDITLSKGKEKVQTEKPVETERPAERVQYKFLLQPPQQEEPNYDVTIYRLDGNKKAKVFSETFAIADGDQIVTITDLEGMIFEVFYGDKKVDVTTE